MPGSMYVRMCVQGGVCVCVCVCVSVSSMYVCVFVWFRCVSEYAHYKEKIIGPTNYKNWSYYLKCPIGVLKG